MDSVWADIFGPTALFQCQGLALLAELRARRPRFAAVMTSCRSINVNNVIEQCPRARASDAHYYMTATMTLPVVVVVVAAAAPLAISLRLLHTHTHTHARTYAVKIYFIMRALLIRGRRKASRRRKFGRRVDRLMLRDTIRDAVLTCTRKLTRVSLFYRTEPTTNGWGKEQN